MKIKIKTMDGRDLCTVTVKNDENICDVKKKIYENKKKDPAYLPHKQILKHEGGGVLMNMDNVFAHFIENAEVKRIAELTLNENAPDVGEDICST